MKPPKRLCTAVLLAFCFCPGLSPALGERQSPFEIPPNGKPDVLIGSMGPEAPSALAFDSRNRPYMFETRDPEHFGYILALREGKWVQLSYVEALRRKYPGLQRPSKRFLHALGTLAIDGSDKLYAVIRVWKQERKMAWVLLYSPDLGGRFDAHELPGAPFLEISTGHNNPGRPPAIGSLVFRRQHPARWTNYYDLQVFLPESENGSLVLNTPVTVSTNCFGISNHSGGYSFAATTGSRTHVVYGEIPPDGKGNPTYAATVDRDNRRVIAKQFLVTASPAVPDVHSTPVIAADSAGQLHVLSGAHGQPFFYMRSKATNSVAGGWSEPRTQGEKQTYASLVCDSRGTLHSVYRVHPRLLYQRKPAAADAWTEPSALVQAPRGHQGYTIFYHRLFIDRADALYLSFTFFEFNSGEQGMYPRALAVSEDNGKSWRLATTALMQARVAAATAQ